MGVIIVSGALANKPGNGGGAWERMSWAVGLALLGYEVHFLEEIASEACRDQAGKPAAVAESANLAWFRFVTGWFEIENRSTLICASRQESFARPWSDVLSLADSADLLINLSGHLSSKSLLERFRCKAYVDVDPGFTQFWHADPNTPFQASGHDFYFTIGENIGSVDCTIPTCGIRWRPTRQPVVLSDWPFTPSVALDRFTTVASWRGPYGPLQADGRTYGLKVHEFRKFMNLPQRIATACEIALDIHLADDQDRRALIEHGWRLVAPHSVAGDPATFREYVQGSGGEFSVAQGVYVETNSGWFSDRSVRYLASGKPVLLQDTGFGHKLPVGSGLLAFRTLDEAVRGAEDIVADYATHCNAAREIAEKHFASDVVLGRLLDEVGL